MIIVKIVLKSGTIVEALAKDEAAYKKLAAKLMNTDVHIPPGEPSFMTIKMTGFHNVYVHPSQVAAVIAEEPEEEVEEADACDECDEVFGSEACESCVVIKGDKDSEE